MIGNRIIGHGGTPRQDLMLPSISDKSTITLDEEHERNLALKRRVQELEGNMKMLQKKYRVNLKDGFQHKIKSFRLQAVVERKVFKQTLENAKRQIQHHQLQQKMRRANHIRDSEVQRMNSITLRLEERRKRVRSNAERQKSETVEKIKREQERLRWQNKETHDRILHEDRHNDRKRKYLEKIQREKFQREQEITKQEYLQKIVTNEETLSKLKEELSLMAEQSKTAGPFITI